MCNKDGRPIIDGRPHGKTLVKMGILVHVVNLIVEKINI
jgi:hypothetical protein